MITTRHWLYISGGFPAGRDTFCASRRGRPRGAGPGKVRGRGFDEHGKARPSLGEYAEAARQSAQELGVAFIDLNAMSKRLYEALGPEKSARAFVTGADGRIDNTHHNNYGSYQLAKCVVQAIRDQNLPIAKFITPDFKPYDPARPDNPDTFAVPASGEFTNERPLGN